MSPAPAPAPSPLQEGSISTTISSPAPPSWRLYETEPPATAASGAAFQQANTTVQQAPEKDSSAAPSPAPAPSPGVALAPVSNVGPALPAIPDSSQQQQEAIAGWLVLPCAC
jgi:hypothetical protein